MKQYKTSKAALIKCLLLLAMLTSVSSMTFAMSSDKGKSTSLSNRQNKGKALSQELDSFANDATLSGDTMVDVIIQFRNLPRDSDNNAVKAEGGLHKGQLNLINGNVYSVPVKALKHLANNPNILYITPDRKSQQFSDYAVQTIGADLVQNSGFDGTGVGVAIIDSGVYAHRDLNDKLNVNSRIVYSESFVAGSDANDYYGHGTHVAGIVGANGNGSNGKIRGIAPGVSIINLRVLDVNGAGTDSGVIAAIQRAIALKDVYNIRVINLSLGHKVFESYTLDPLCQAVEQAWQAGIVVVTAAGNSGRDYSMGTKGYATISTPGNDPYVITVGASNTEGTPNRSDDIIASFSSKGPTLVDHVAKPDVIAPGNRIASLEAPGSTLVVNNPSLTVNPAVYGDYTLDTSTAYLTLSGTSMATPMVSGAAALLLQKNPTMTPDQVKARLMKTATKFYRGNAWAKDLKGNQWNLQYDIFTQGAGYIDVNAAINSTDVSTGSAISPTVVRDSLTGVVALNSNNPNSVWNNSVVWGASVVWGGDAFLAGSSVIWGSSVVWGGGDLTATSVIWGSSVVWGGGDMLALSAGDADDDGSTTTP